MIFYYKGEYVADGWRVSPDDLHVRFGVGFFETLYYSGQMIRYLDAHLERVFHSMEQFQIAYAKAPWEEVVAELLQRNGLAGGTAKVNIFYPVADFGQRAQPLIQVSPWQPESGRTYRLAVYPWHQTSYLSGHKSMNYMHNVLAKRHARQQDRDDALLTDSAGQVLETSACALLFSDGSGFVAPKSDFTLRSVSLARAAGALPIRHRPVRLAELPEFRHAYVLNSLIGMRPVTSIGGTAYEPDEKSCELATLRIL
ncbi:MAG: aminotransferase class IV [Desulfocurvibacter africanus]